MALVTAAIVASLGVAKPQSSPGLASLSAPGAASATTAFTSVPLSTVSATAASALPLLSTEELESRFLALEKNFRARRSVLSAAGAPIPIEGEPAWLRAEFRPGMEQLAAWGSPRAAAWLLRHFHTDASDDAALVIARKCDLYRQVLPRFASTEWLDSNEIDVTQSLLLDAILLGPRLTSEFASAVLEANPARFQRRSVVLRAQARAVLGVGEADQNRRKFAAEIWREELARAAGTSWAAYAENELWRIENFWIGDRAPALTASDVDGNEIGVRDLRGKVIVVAFFRLGSRADLAWALRLRELARANEHQHFALLGVELGASEIAFRRLVEEHELRFPCVYESTEPGEVATAWRLNEVPRALVLDTTGRLRHVDLDGAALEETVETLLRESVGLSTGAHGRTPTRR